MHVAGSSAVTRSIGHQLPALIRRRGKAIPGVKMMWICYLSVVAMACIFGCGEAQTTTEPPEDDLGLLFIQYEYRSKPEYQGLLFFTLSLDTFKLKPIIYDWPPCDECDGDEVYDVAFWIVKSPKRALKEANTELNIIYYPWEKENTKDGRTFCMFFDYNTKLYLSTVMKATKEFRVSEVRILNSDLWRQFHFNDVLEEDTPN